MYCDFIDSLRIVNQRRDNISISNTAFLASRNVVGNVSRFKETIFLRSVIRKELAAFMGVDSIDNERGKGQFPL